VSVLTSSKQLGKFVEHFKAAAVMADSKNLDPVIKYCAVGRQLGYAGYMTFDTLTFLDAAGIRKSPTAKRLQQEAYRCWMIGLLFSAVSGTYSLYNLRQQQARVDKKDGEGVVTSKRIEKYTHPLHKLLMGRRTDNWF
jgi:peroxin-11B